MVQNRNRRTVPFHPVLFAVAPILFVYTFNASKIPIDPRELPLPIALSLAMAGVVWAVLGLVFRSATRAAPAVSFFLLLFFSYGHIAGVLGSESRGWTDLLVLWLLLLAAGIWLAARRARRATRGPHSGLTVLLNSVATAVFAVNLVTGARSLLHRPPRVEREARPAATTSGDYPDIYYIITDSYARSDVLESRYHTDNSAFLGDLEHLGFFVVDRARSNYAGTYHSLASSLNFTYLDSLAGAAGAESEDYGPLISMIQHSRLVDFLRHHGYSVVSFASGYAGTDLADADVHFAPLWSPSEFQNVLANTTMLWDLLYLLRMSPKDLHRARIMYTLQNLPLAGRGRHPVFVWAHIVCPHKPFVFDARGGRPKYYLGVDLRGTMRDVNKVLVRQWLDEYYGPQVIYLNTLLDEVVRKILAESSRPPIIIIQGDHGPGAMLNWGEPDRDEPSELAERHSILDVIYLPPSGRGIRPPAQLYDSISPVNTFRVVLSTYFDTTMSLLPDRSYLATFHRPFRFIEVDRSGFCPATKSAGAH